MNSQIIEPRTVLPKEDARQGTTGHNVRYVLGVRARCRTCRSHRGIRGDLHFLFRRLSGGRNSCGVDTLASVRSVGRQPPRPQTIKT
jgi:hypothetical protein